MEYGVLLLGDHPRLPGAEVAALQDVEDPRHDHSEFEGARVAFKLHRDVARRVTQRLAWGRVWFALQLDHPDFDALLRRAVTHWALGGGERPGVDNGNSVEPIPPGTRVAARASTFGLGQKGGATIERAIGAALANGGLEIDLDTPDVTIFAWIGGGVAWIGELLGGRNEAYWDRHLEKRAHFSPIGLHPRRAAGLIHLARVAPGGTIYDPFCGTGGLVMEAANLGFKAMGSDLDAWMVQGTLQTLADAAAEPLDGVVFEADIGAAPAMVGTVDGIVTDLPYGGASSSRDETMVELYDRAFAAFALMLNPGSFAVVGHKDPELLKLAAKHGFEVRAPKHNYHGQQDIFEEYVHKSMTRRFAVLRRV